MERPLRRLGGEFWFDLILFVMNRMGNESTAESLGGERGRFRPSRRRAALQSVCGIFSAVQRGFYFHPTDQKSVRGDPGRKKPLSSCGFALQQLENRSRTPKFHG